MQSPPECLCKERARRKTAHYRFLHSCEGAGRGILQSSAFSARLGGRGWSESSPRGHTCKRSDASSDQEHTLDVLLRFSAKCGDGSCSIVEVEQVGSGFATLIHVSTARSTQ